MFGFGKIKSYLGVDLGAGGVKLVELREEKKRPVLFTYGLTTGAQNVHRLLDKKELTAVELAAGANDGQKEGTAGGASSPMLMADDKQAERYAGIIRSVCAEAKVKTKMAVASLPVSAVFHAIVTLPLVKKEEFNRILRAEVKKLLPYPLEEMVLDSQIIPGAPGAASQKVLVNAVPRALVVFYTKIFKLAGLNLESLEPESVALSRSLIGRDTATTMLVDIGAERTNFFIIDQAVPITHHSLEMGGARINAVLERLLGIEPGITEQLKRDVFTHLIEGGDGGDGLLPRAKFLEFFNSVVDPILKEIEYSLEMFLRQSDNQNKRPEKVILTGGGALFPYLAEEIAGRFKVKCYIGDPWGRVVYQDGLRPILRSIAPRLAVSIGLALRNVVY
ncbi:MAG: Type IV pilus assembly protein PilM [Candidatus Kaiserbacteria bacterium GW2011_GWA2_49_19]|uniref:Type IV pilus assembly protein PilM n=1 Tax=Candidatus Kaiserbacteria bacterium GW2011_GWA2_49_19 TaxID=1618669 RepID=A0A0G1VP61_9BACT|nr:MAG: Type IV pilus assembly protein PilM [Candidatus Kaiserbacteria bacterium GW2011_GWA2_49_19]